MKRTLALLLVLVTLLSLCACGASVPEKKTAESTTPATEMLPEVEEVPATTVDIYADIDWSQAYDNFLQTYDFSKCNIQEVYKGYQDAYILAQDDSVTYERYENQSGILAVYQSWDNKDAKTIVLTTNVENSKRTYYTTVAHNKKNVYTPVDKNMFRFPYDDAIITYDKDTMDEGIKFDILKVFTPAAVRKENFNAAQEQHIDQNSGNNNSKKNIITENEETLLQYIIECEYDGQTVRFEYVLANGIENFGPTTPNDFNRRRNKGTPWKIDIDNKVITDGTNEIPFTIISQTDDPFEASERQIHDDNRAPVLGDINAYVYVNREYQQISKIKVEYGDELFEVRYLRKAIPSVNIPEGAVEITYERMMDLFDMSFPAPLSAYEP